MAPAVVRMVSMPDAFEDTKKAPVALSQSGSNLLFPRSDPYKPPKAAQDAHINLLTYTREPPTRPYVSTGLAPTELDRVIRNAALLPGPGAYHPRLDAVAARIRHVNIKATKSTSSPLLALARRKFPGPGAYEVAGDLVGVGVRFTKDRRKPLGIVERTPGPGAYQPTAVLGVSAFVSSSPSKKKLPKGGSLTQACQSQVSVQAAMQLPPFARAASWYAPMTIIEVGWTMTRSVARTST